MCSLHTKRGSCKNRHVCEFLGTEHERRRCGIMRKLAHREKDAGGRRGGGFLMGQKKGGGGVSPNKIGVSEKLQSCKKKNNSYWGGGGGRTSPVLEGRKKGGTTKKKKKREHQWSRKGRGLLVRVEEG